MTQLHCVRSLWTVSLSSWRLLALRPYWDVSIQGDISNAERDMALTCLGGLLLPMQLTLNSKCARTNKASAVP